MIDPKLQDKVVLITGANHGIGAAAAQTFARQGSKVFINYFRGGSAFSEGEMRQAREDKIGGPALYAAMHQKSGTDVAAAINNEGGTAVALELDLSIIGSIPTLFDACEERLGPVDILVNNHTHCVLETFDPAQVTNEGFAIGAFTEKEADKHFAINSRAYAMMMAEFARRFLARRGTRGRIINISTDAAHAHEANVHYAASKHAIESYSRSAALELGRYGITVNIVAPGPIQTGYISPAVEGKIASDTPLKRVGQPQDVADVILFMASAQSDWLTGQLLYVGGGWRMSQ